MIYLDNSASTYIKPKQVIKAVSDALLCYTANPGRSGHNASIKAALQVEKAREIVADFFNAKAENVVWTQNCTHALNLAILGCVKEGGHIITTENEHNSVLRPLQHLKKEKNICYSVAKQQESTGITLEDIKKHIKPNTYMVICNHLSNVNGDKAEIKEIGQYCRENNLIFVVDGAQSGGHIPIDIVKNNIDFLTIAGHKGFYAPQSIGALIMNKNYKPNPILFGGTGTNSVDLTQPNTSPERYESGTISTPLIMGLMEGINFVKSNFSQITNKLDDLTTYLNYELRALGITSYTSIENSYGVLSFNINNLDSSFVANTLNSKYGICVRSGLHCAPLKHQALGTTEQGTVRVSLSFFNTFSEIQKLLIAVKQIKRTSMK